MTRNALLLGTALQSAAMLTLMPGARAQIAPNTRPAGGVVTGGQASIGGNASTTLITQASQNAVINWQTYNIGSAQTVQYVQPNSSSMTLNRVLTPDPSVIAGRITANGQVAIVNQSGVLFVQGSQVDTAGLVVSAANITNQNFMAGRLIFNQAPRPGAMISNAGNITVRQAGLAALVAPQVANSGTITAQLGRVVLGGAVTHTLDLYGDGLVALNVTGQVTKASLGGKQVQALVTNTGTILAPGGTVVLSAAAMDGVVTNLVAAGGTIAAPSVGGQVGRILVQGVGGGLVIDGAITATGVAAGTRGGQVVADATGNVTVAAGAQVDASGDAGGGLIAIGTTAARAAHGPGTPSAMTAANVAIGAGATLRADARRIGRGGRIAVLSRGTTRHAGSISAQGPQGGWVEVSGKTLALSGGIDAGAGGTVLLDPQNIVIESSGNVAPGTTQLTPTYVDSLKGDIIIEADGTLDVLSNVSLNKGANSLELRGDEGIFIDATVSAPGLPVLLYSAFGPIAESATLNSGAAVIAGSLAAYSPKGMLTLGGHNELSAIAGFDNASSSLLSGTVVTDGYSGQPRPVDELSIGSLVAGGDITIDDMATLTDEVNITGSNITLTDASALKIAGTLTANAVALEAARLTESGAVTATTLSGDTTFDALLTTNGNSISNLRGFTAGGRLILTDDMAITLSGAISAGKSINITDTFGIDQVSGNLDAGALSLTATSGDITFGGTLQAGILKNGNYTGTATLIATSGNITETGTGALLTGMLTGFASGSVALDTTSGPHSGNQIADIVSLSAGTSITLVDGQALAIDTLALNDTAGTPFLALVAPALTINGSIDFTDMPGLARLVANQFAIPGKIGDAGGTVTLDLLNGSLGTIFSVGKVGDTVTVGALDRITTGTLALGSLDAVTASPGNGGGTWGIGSGGMVSTLQLGNARFAPTASALGLFSNGDIVSTAGITVASLYGSAATMASFTGLNLIDMIGAPQGKLGFMVGNGATPTATTDFTLTDDVALTIARPVTVEDGGISVDVTRGALTVAGSGDMTGTEVWLEAEAGIAQGAGGTIEAKGASGSGGTIALLADHGGIMLGGQLEADAGGAVLLAAAGSIAETGKDTYIATDYLAASAGGGIMLGAHGNMIDAITRLYDPLTGGDLAGLTANGPGGITLVDNTNLLITDGTFITASGENAAVTIKVKRNDALTIGSTPQGATITADGNLTLKAGGALTQNGGIVQSLDGDILMSSQAGSIVLDGLVETQGQLEGDRFVAAGPSAVVLSAAGDITEGSTGSIVTAMLSALAGHVANGGTGSLLLNSKFNEIAAIAPGGLAAGSNGGNVALVDVADLTVTDGATVSAGAGAINLTTTGADGLASLTIGTLLGANVLAAEGITLIAGGAFSQTGGVVNSTAGNVAVTSAASGIIDTNGVIGAGGNVTLDALTNLVAADATINAHGGITLLAGGAFSQSGGAIDSMAGDVTVTTGGAITDTNGLIGADGNVTLDARTNLVAAGANIEADGGSITLIAGGAFSQIGGTIESAAGDVAVISTGGGITDSNGVIIAGKSLSLDAQTTLVATDASITADDDITLTAGGAFSQIGGTIGSAAGNIAVTSTGGGITDSNGVISAGSNVSLDALTDLVAVGADISADGGITVAAGGAFSQNGGTIDSAAGNVAVTTTGGAITETNGNMTAGGGITLRAGSAFSQAGGAIDAVAGNVLVTSAGGGITETNGNITAGGGITLNTGGAFSQMGGMIDATAGNVAVTSTGGAITDTNGVISAGSNVTLVALTNLIANSADIKADGGITLNAGGAFNQTGGTIDSTAGNVAVTAARGSITDSDGNITADGGITLHAGGAFSQTGGTIDSTAGNVLVASAGGGITDTNGVISAGGNATLDALTNLVAAGADISAGGSVTLQAGNAFSQTGGTIDAAAGNVAVTSTGGGITDTNGLIGAGSNVVLDALTDVVAAGASIEADAGITVNAGGAFSQTGGTIDSAAGNVAVTSAGGGITDTNGLISAGGNLSLDALTTLVAAGANIKADGGITLTAGGAFSQSGGTITSSAGSVVATSTGGGITDTNGVITAGSNVMLDALTDLDVTGAHITAGGVASLIAGDDLVSTNASLGAGGAAFAEATAGSLAASGSSFTGASANLYAGAGISLTASNVSATAGDANLVTGGALTEDGKSVVSAFGNATLAAAGSIVQDTGGVVTAGGTAAFAATSGLLDIEGTVGGPNGGFAATVLLYGPNVTESLGTIRATDFAAAAAGTISLLGSFNQIGTLVAASIDAPSLGPQSGAAPIALAGLTGTEIMLRDASSLSEAPGASLTAATLSLTSGGAIVLGNGGNAVGTVETLTAVDSLTLMDSISMTLAAGATVTAQTGAVVLSDAADIAQLGGGTISAPYEGAPGAAGTITLDAAGTIRLAGDMDAPAIFLGGESGAAKAVVWNGNTIKTGTTAPDGRPLKGGSFGLVVDADTLVQTGTTRITPFGASASTVQITLAGEGSARFADLVAPTTQFLFDLRGGGSVSGSIAVGALTVVYDAGQVPPDVTRLIGTVDGKQGVAAAAVSTPLLEEANGNFSTLPSLHYLINGCAIGSIDCVLISPVTVPVVDPVPDFTIATSAPSDGEDDLLPNVAVEDF